MSALDANVLASVLVNNPGTRNKPQRHKAH